MYSSLYFNIKKFGRWSLYCYNDLNNWYIWNDPDIVKVAIICCWICNRVLCERVWSKWKCNKSNTINEFPPFSLLFFISHSVMVQLFSAFWGFCFAIFHCLFRTQFPGLYWWQLQLQRMSNLRAILSCCLLLTGVKSPIETWITLFPVSRWFIVWLSTGRHPVLGSEAATRQFTLHQGKALVANYATEFGTYTSESGWKDATLWGASVKGFSEEFKDELAVQDEADYYETVSTCNKPQYLFQGGAARERGGDNFDSGLLVFSGSDLSSCPAPPVTSWAPPEEPMQLGWACLNPSKKHWILSSRVMIVWWTIRPFHCLLASLIKRLARWQMHKCWWVEFSLAPRSQVLCFGPPLSFLLLSGLMTASLTRMGTNSLISPLRCSWSPN